LFDLLDQTVDIAKKYKAVTVFAGDVFHLKQPSRNSHALVQRMLDTITKYYPHEVYIVPGNHDLLNDRLDSLVSQPLGVLLKSGANLLQGWAPGLPVYGVPWLQRFTDSAVSDALFDYRDNVEFVKEHSLVVAHAPLYPPGKELPYEFYPSVKWAEYMGQKGNVAYGHVHDFHGVWDSLGVQFCNNGALSRGSLTEHNRTRKVYTTIWSSLNGEFKRIELNAKKAEEVFKIEKADREKQLQIRLDDFLTAIGQTTIEITSIDSVLTHVQSLGIEDSLVAVVKELLEEVTER
jgi:DNA repair exonuclease SbcCD nuclease subunit